MMRKVEDWNEIVNKQSVDEKTIFSKLRMMSADGPGGDTKIELYQAPSVNHVVAQMHEEWPYFDGQGRCDSYTGATHVRKGKKITLPKDMGKDVETIKNYLRNFYNKKFYSDDASDDDDSESDSSESEYEEDFENTFYFVEVDESEGQKYLNRNGGANHRYIYSGRYFTKPDIAAYNASQPYEEYHIEDTLMPMPPLRYFVCIFSKMG